MSLSTSLRRVAPVALLALALPGPAAHADKLVVFQNGRSIRVAEIRRDGEWTYLGLGRKSEMGVPTNLIASVTEAQGQAQQFIPGAQASAAGGPSEPRGSHRPTVNAAAPNPPDPPAIEDDTPTPQDGEDASGAAGARRSGLASRRERVARDRTATGETQQPPGGLELAGGVYPGKTARSGETEPPAVSGGVVGGDAGGASKAWPSLLDRNRAGKNKGKSATPPANEDTP